MKNNLKFFVKLIDEKSKPPFKKNATDSGFDVFVHSFKKAYIKSIYKEELLEADSRGILPGITTTELGATGADYLEVQKNSLPESVTLNPMERLLIGTGFHGFVSDGTDNVYELQARPRSGLSWDHALVVLNTPGTIDSPYRGEVKIILTNLSQQAQEISIGDKIAQLVPALVPMPEVVIVDQLDETERGDKGFGASGKI